jgi:hypothetical protein
MTNPGFASEAHIEVAADSGGPLDALGRSEAQRASTSTKADKRSWRGQLQFFAGRPQMTRTSARVKDRRDARAAKPRRSGFSYALDGMPRFTEFLR